MCFFIRITYFKCTTLVFMLPPMQFLVFTTAIKCFVTSCTSLIGLHMAVSTNKLVCRNVTHSNSTQTIWYIKLLSHNKSHIEFLFICYTNEVYSVVFFRSKNTLCRLRRWCRSTFSSQLKVSTSSIAASCNNNCSTYLALLKSCESSAQAKDLKFSV